MLKIIQYYHQGKCKLSLVTKTRKQTSKRKSIFWWDNYKNFLPVTPRLLNTSDVQKIAIICCSVILYFYRNDITSVVWRGLCEKKNWLGLYMLWFKFIFGLKFFELVSILFAIVPDYGNEYTTKENKNWTSFQNLAPKLNLNHHIYFARLFFPDQN